MLWRTRERDGAMLLSCALVLFAAALAAAAVERESQLAQAPFVLGSRFGRSPPRLLMPRNDKFFFSSRYGKRSGPGGDEDPLPASTAPAAPALVCDYTGVRALYRCRPDNYHDDRRMDSSSPEEI